MKPWLSNRPCPLCGSLASSTRLHPRERFGASFVSGHENTYTRSASTVAMSGQRFRLRLERRRASRRRFPYRFTTFRHATADTSPSSPACLRSRLSTSSMWPHPGRSMFVRHPRMPRQSERLARDRAATPSQQQVISAPFACGKYVFARPGFRLGQEHPAGAATKIHSAYFRVTSIPACSERPDRQSRSPRGAKESPFQGDRGPMGLTWAPHHLILGGSQRKEPCSGSYIAFQARQ
jgi:hypothetical protein